MCFVISFRAEECIASGGVKYLFIDDPVPNKICTKRKARECSILLPDFSSQNNSGTRVKYLTNGWGKALENLPLFTQAEMKKQVENYGKRIGNAEHHSVPTSRKRAKTFLQDEYFLQGD